MNLFVLLSSTENRYLVLSRCSYIVLDEVSSFNLFLISVCLFGFFFAKFCIRRRISCFTKENSMESPTRLYSIIRLQKI